MLALALSCAGNMTDRLLRSPTCSIRARSKESNTRAAQPAGLDATRRANLSCARAGALAAAEIRNRDRGTRVRDATRLNSTRAVLDERRVPRNAIVLVAAALDATLTTHLAYRNLLAQDGVAAKETTGQGHASRLLQKGRRALAGVGVFLFCIAHSTAVIYPQAAIEDTCCSQVLFGLDDASTLAAHIGIGRWVGITRRVLVTRSDASLAVVA